jgi:putative CocE/NonD family hydrolase
MPPEALESARVAAPLDGADSSIRNGITPSILEAIGHTPLIPLRRIALGVRPKVLIELESLNPDSSIKDRVGVAMVVEAERRGWLQPGGTIIEATAGNTGVGLALAAAVKGYRCIFVLPDKMSGEKIRLLSATRLAELVLALSSIYPSTAHGQPPSVTERRAEYQYVVDKDISIVMRDGTKLSADLYRPARGQSPAEGRFPTLLTRTPYGKAGDAAEGRYFASRGYNVVSNDVRGRHASEGIWRLLVDDPADGYDVAEWISRQPWSDGQIGTFGSSYQGGTQHALAEMNPPALRAMVPGDAVSDCGIGGMRTGGAFELRMVNWVYVAGAAQSRTALASPALKLALNEAGAHVRDVVENLPIRPGDTQLRVVPEYEAWLVDAMRNGPESPFWKAKGPSVLDHINDYADVPVLHVSGWYDPWVRQTTLNYRALSKAKSSPQRMVIGPWVHGGQATNVAGEVEFTPDSAIDFRAWRLRWFDRWLKAQRNGVDDDPRALFYVMGTGDDRKSAAGRLRHGGFWRSAREWPPADTHSSRFYLHADGSLSTAIPHELDSKTIYTFDPLHPVPTIGGTPMVSNGGFNQFSPDRSLKSSGGVPLSARRDVLVFRTGLLAEDMEVIGDVVVNLWVSSSAPDTDFTVKLIDEIPPNADYALGFDLNICDGIQRVRYRESLEHPVLVRPGEVVRVTITLPPTANVFKKGHRIRLDVSSSNFPKFDVNPNTGAPLGIGRRMVVADNVVYHDARHPSSCDLPVRSATSHARDQN